MLFLISEFGFKKINCGAEGAAAMTAEPLARRGTKTLLPPRLIKPNQA
jgi:hypothetical protein